MSTGQIQRVYLALKYFEPFMFIVLTRTDSDSKDKV